ncbi:ABC transporter permease [Methanobrevibacter sp.]|uniref:ABC transporter permease n=1 Tax=Methanobrevibacter sp. TaxID=66852 RepID=UPI0025EC5A6E|nr:ABC transporter permease [Methanobrevibacter sp.]MBQ2831064.1 ABC transporter permease [Methanobrevibacter sp.]
MLAKKMIRDILNHKTLFISIFLMAFLGVFVFAGVGGESVGLEVNIDNYYEETNLADGWIYSPYLNDLFLEQVNLLGPTTQMERQLVVDSVADFENGPEVTLHFVENNTISKFYLLEGEPLDINDSEGVWLDKSFADAKGLEVGDNISFECEGYTIEKEIKGLGYSPEYVYHASSNSLLPDFNEIGFAYMSYKAFPEDTVPYNVLNVKFKGSPDTFGKLLDYRLEGYYSTFVERSEHPSVNQFSQEITKHKMMADVFPVVFIIITMLILFTTMTRIIAHQRTQIGILKASGFKNTTIMWHYISYGFWPVLIGSVLGLILGPIILPQIFHPSMVRTYKMPLWSPAWDMTFVYVMAFMVIVSLVVSYYAISSITNEKPSDTIKPKAPKASTSGFIEKSKIWKRLSFNIRWNYRDAKRNKLRGIMTIIGVMGCSALLVGSFGLHDGMNDIKEWEYSQINHYDSKLVIDNASASQIDVVVAEVNGESIMEKAIEIESDDVKKSGSLLVLDSTDLITPTDDDWNKVDIANDEVSISKKMADILGVGVGDTVKWHIMGSNKWVEVKIDKIHADPISQGFIMSSDKLEELGLNYTPTSVITSEHVDGTYDGFKETNHLSDIEISWSEITQTMWLIIYVLMFFACTLAIIVLYNLGLLSFTEIEREISTLKVLGFKSNDLRRLLLTQNLFFTVIGFILGIPLGLYILTVMWQSSGDSFCIVPSLTLTNVMLTAMITFSLSIIVNLMFSSKIKKLDMVESLKGAE